MKSYMFINITKRCYFIKILIHFLITDNRK